MNKQLTLSSCIGGDHHSRLAVCNMWLAAFWFVGFQLVWNHALSAHVCARVWYFETRQCWHQQRWLCVWITLQQINKRPACMRIAAWECIEIGEAMDPFDTCCSLVHCQQTRLHHKFNNYLFRCDIYSTGSSTDNEQATSPHLVYVSMMRMIPSVAVGLKQLLETWPRPCIPALQWVVLLL
jgi:hypothetical protein